MVKLAVFLAATGILVIIVTLAAYWYVKADTQGDIRHQQQRFACSIIILVMMASYVIFLAFGIQRLP